MTLERRPNQASSLLLKWGDISEYSFPLLIVSEHLCHGSSLPGSQLLLAQGRKYVVKAKIEAFALNSRS